MIKISNEQLRQIIKEELDSLMNEQEGEQVMRAIMDVPKAAEQIAVKIKKEIETLAKPSGLDPLVLAQAVAALITTK